jgi:hypothetical protein
MWLFRGAYAISLDVAPQKSIVAQRSFQNIIQIQY